MSYIKRESLKARIEASPLFSNFGEDGYFIKDFVVELIERLPTADVVAVVRCRDCKYKITANFNGEILIGCSNPSGLVDICADGFCSYGERREE